MEDLNKTIATTVASAIEAQAKAQFLTALGGTDHLIERFPPSPPTRRSSATTARFRCSTT